MQKFIDVLLEKLQPSIQYLVDKQKPEFEELFKRPMNNKDEEMAKLLLTYKLLSSIEIYTLPTDRLVKLNYVNSQKGFLTINAVIERDGQEYNLYTEVIGAGGYNIQGFHYRYITNTNLPKKGSLVESKKIDEHIKNLTNIEKLEKEIETYKKRIYNNKKVIPINEEYNDEQVLDAIRKEKEKESERTGNPIYERPTWEEIVRRGADKNYNYSEQEFNDYNEKHKKDSIERWRDSNIRMKKVHLKDYEKSLKKLESKLDVLMQKKYDFGGLITNSTPDYLRMFLG